VTGRISLERTVCGGMLDGVTARRKQPDVTRRLLLEAAHECFSTRGHAGSGIGAVIARAGTTSGALFHHFADKRELTLAWIREVLAARLHEEWIAPLSAVGSLDELRVLVRDRCTAIDPSSPVSALAAVGAEIAGAEPTLRDAIDTLIREWHEALEATIERGRSEGWIHRGIRPENESKLIIASICGLAVTARMTTDPSHNVRIAAAIDGYLDTLRPL